MLKVLMQNRVDAFECPGGDTVSMLHLQEQLMKMGVRIDVSLELNPDCSSYDVVSLFNIVRVHETYAQFRNAKRQGKRVVVMPIYWDFSELDLKGRNHFVGSVRKLIGRNGLEFLKNMVRISIDRRQRQLLTYQIRRSYAQQQREVITRADIVTPNSYMEADILKKEMGDFASQVVYNGVSENFQNGDGKQFKSKWDLPYEKFGLCIGRFDERKNQLGLIRALKEIRIPIVFIGDPGPNHRAYLDKCRKEAESTFFVFLPHLSHEELINAYHAAHMHVQSSWLETPGLTNLEAGLAGCNLVLSDRGSVREYFGNAAWYCEPDNSASIRSAVKSAFAAPRQFHSKLTSRILDHFTWRRSARAMLDAYNAAVHSLSLEGPFSKPA
jgi:glycosyltransferase involved in cell wall biosynthesis